MKWTKDQMEALADRFAKVFVDAVEHAGGTATIADSAAAQQKRGTDALPCGHSDGIVFGENSWTCAVCGQPAHRSR